MTQVENYDWISDEQKAKWKAEGHWPPPGTLWDPKLKPSREEIIKIGKEVEDRATLLVDSGNATIGRIIQKYPKSSTLVMLSKICLQSELPRIKEAIEKAESE